MRKCLLCWCREQRQMKNSIFFDVFISKRKKTVESSRMQCGYKTKERKKSKVDCSINHWSIRLSLPLASASSSLFLIMCHSKLAWSIWMTWQYQQVFDFIRRDMILIFLLENCKRKPSSNDGYFLTFVRCVKRIKGERERKNETSTLGDHIHIYFKRFN